MKTEAFLDILEQRKLVPADIVAKLRAKAKQSDKRITSKSVLKYLVKKELVTRRQAKDLLTTTLTVNDKAESSILGMVPLPEQPSEREAKAVKPMISPIEPTAPIVNKPDNEPTSVEPAAESGVSPLASGALKPLEGPTQSGLLDEALAAEAGGFGGGDDQFGRAAGDAKTKKRRGKKKKGKQSEWDSPLLLLGGGALVLLLVGGSLIYYLLIRENSDAVLEEAIDFFNGGSYTQAERSYQHFVEDWPRHPQHSEAKVRLGMTRIWMKTDNTKDFVAALDAAKKSLDEIEDEEAFAEDRESKAELSSLLTTIAEGLADQADQSSDPNLIADRLAQTKEALALTANTKFVPTSLVLKDRLEPVQETLERVEQRQQRNVDLAAALAGIDQAIADQKPAEAYEIHKQLVKKYAVLHDNEQLAEKLLEIAAAEQATVRFVPQEQPAETAPRDSPVIASMALAEQSGPAGADAGVAVVRVDGALYGIDVKGGRLLWRQFVGYAPSASPLALGDRVFAADAQTGDLVCLAVDSGELLWRQPLGDRLATPVALEDQLLVAGEAGKLYVVNQANGELRGAVEFSQPLLTPPTVNRRSRRIYLVGSHSNLYSLSTEDFACVGVYYVGHSASAIGAPPVAVSNKVVVAQNSGAETSLLRVLGLDNQSAVANQAAESRLEGLVTTPLVVNGRRVGAVTSQGEAAVFEIGAGEGNAALVEVAGREAVSGKPTARFAWMDDKHLWMAGQELTKFGIVASGNRLPVRSLDQDYAGGVFDHSLTAFGYTLVHVRRSAGKAGAYVGGIDMSEGRSLWQCRVAVPLAGPPAVDPKSMQISAVNAGGAAFVLDRDALSRRVTDRASRATTPIAAPLTDSVDLGSGRQAASAAGAQQLLVTHPAEDASQVKSIELPGELACDLATWGNACVAATEVGQVLLVDAAHEAHDANVATPFQPDVEPNQQFNWLTPTAIGVPGDGALFVSDGVQKIYRVELIAEPRPHLEAVVATEIPASPLTTRLAVVGEALFAGDATGRLFGFDAANLEKGPTADLGGPIVWGPYAAGEGLLVAIETGELVAVDPTGEVRWRQPLTHGPLAGAPSVDAGEATVTARNGGVIRLQLSDGEEAGFAAVNQPLTSGPVAMGADRLAVSAADGAILVLKRP